ncbi:MAG: hypothetical protein AAF206_24025 [Bacteroidota bacterium]
MRLLDLKGEYMRQKAQIMLFDRKGVLLESCHALADVKPMLGQSVYELFPIIDSMQSVIWEQNKDADPIRIPAVDFSLNQRKGYFDFELFPHPEQEDQAVWILIDQTRVYKYFQKVQQQRNVMLVEKEYRENGRDIDIQSALD